MIVSTKGRYALRVMVDLAGHPAEGYIPLREIARRQGISEKYLEIILKKLVREKIVVGLRGKGGGYRLNRAPEEYTVGEILRCTEDSLAPVACLGDSGNPCPRAAGCPTLPMWEKLDAVVHNFFDSYTIADLMNTRPLTGEKKEGHR